ncbi:hypothetical protein SLEP1_g57788 [Rubroshorea leprosula]|uniref:Uncharacterized protein n=1 Tax=Rubroshorea leprosula TaxID=152421 RepID=A0AAV5MQ48_9ROSI|nr:hypothetical protein SLEP1_g57788 [Rubroshorea leprosula]
MGGELLGFWLAAGLFFSLLGPVLAGNFCPVCMSCGLLKPCSPAREKWGNSGSN